MKFLRKILERIIERAAEKVAVYAATAKPGDIIIFRTQKRLSEREEAYLIESLRRIGDVYGTKHLVFYSDYFEVVAYSENAKE